jgi:hypothetical protein
MLKSYHTVVSIVFMVDSVLRGPDIVFRVILDPGREVAFGPRLITPRTPDNIELGWGGGGGVKRENI